MARIGLSRVARSRAASVGLGIIVFWALIAILAPWISPYVPTAIDFAAAMDPSPSAGHWLGSDTTGRDMASRLIWGARTTFVVVPAAVGTAFLVGGVAGLCAGWYGGWIDSTLSRAGDIMLAFPALLLYIVLITSFGASLLNIVIAVTLAYAPGMARLMRGQVLSLKEMDYVTAARGVGASDTRLIGVHIFPGVLPFILVSATLQIAGVILAESGLSFIGLGVQIPTATWGNMMNAAQSMHILRNIPWLWVPPGLAISATVIAVNFVGDGLRDALDPRSGTSV